MADTGTHIISGVSVGFLTQTTYDEKALIVLGAVLPDIIFPLYFYYVAKRSGKKASAMDEGDYTLHGYSTKTIRSLKRVYYMLHGLPFIAVLFLIGLKYSLVQYVAIGTALHFLYDLFTHQYDDELFRPRPLYPLSSKSFGYGITNGWRMKRRAKVILWSFNIVFLAVSLLVAARI
jgi:hypothetical protein